MAPASRKYTLVGFYTELDWRPLTFLKPVPANRVCSACGLVRRRTVFLPCMHVLCECCYEQCCQPECPLDGNGFEKDDVTLMDYPADGLLRREVKCWNEGSGCQYSTAASGIAEHFQRECEHHSVRCPKCSATVLCKDVCLHLRSTSCNTSTHLAPESQAALVHMDEMVSLTYLKEAFERQANEVTAYLSPIAVDISTHGDRLDELSHDINTLKETLRQELASLTLEAQESVTKSVLEIVSSNYELKETFVTCSDKANTCLTAVTNLEKTLSEKLSGIRDDLSRIESAIGQVEAAGKESVHKILQHCGSVGRRSLLEATQCEFLVKGVKSLQDTAMKKGSAVYESEMVYLRGYCMTPGVCLHEYSAGTGLYASYTICKGDMDDAVQWPFQHNLSLRIIHPRQGADVVLGVKTDPRDTCNQKPTAVSRNTYGLFSGLFSLDSLINDGYVADDQLRMMLELKP